MAIDEFMVDKRIVDRNMTSGKLNRAEYKARLDALPDLADQVYRPEDDEATDESEPREGDG